MKPSMWQRLLASLEQYQRDLNNDGPATFKPSVVDVRALVDVHAQNTQLLKDLLEYLPSVGDAGALCDSGIKARVRLQITRSEQ